MISILRILRVMRIKVGRVLHCAPDIQRSTFGVQRSMFSLFRTAHFVFPVLLLTLTVARAQDAGFGPQISVSRDLPPTAEVKPHNLIDQTWAEARVKSAGCLECHKGID